MRAMDLDDLRSWLERYFAAWRSNDRRTSRRCSRPTRCTRTARSATRPAAATRIVRRWVEGGAQPGLRTAFEPLAVEGERGVAHWQVSFDDGDGRTEIDGILVLDFDGRGRCVLHREWYDTRHLPS